MGAIFFGQYLLSKGIIDRDALIDGIELQRKRNLSLTALAVRRGYLESKDEEAILLRYRTSDADLEALLARYASGHSDAAAPSGSLMFSCLGRGAGLYGHADHDTGLFRRHLGEVPLGGFFCNGEIGEVQGRTFLHGYTSSFGLFRERS